MFRLFVSIFQLSVLVLTGLAISRILIEFTDIRLYGTPAAIMRAYNEHATWLFSQTVAQLIDMRLPWWAPHAFFATVGFLFLTPQAGYHAVRITTRRR